MHWFCKIRMFTDMKGGEELQHCYHISDFDQWHKLLVDVVISSIHECLLLLKLEQFIDPM